MVKPSMLSLSLNQNSTERSIVNQVKGVNNGARTFYSLYVEILIADEIGREGRTPFFTGF